MEQRADMWAAKTRDGEPTGTRATRRDRLVGAATVFVAICAAVLTLPGAAAASGLGVYDATNAWVGDYMITGAGTAVVYVPVDGLAAEFVYEDDDTLSADGRIEFQGSNCTGTAWGRRNPEIPAHTGLAQVWLIVGQPLYVAAAEAAPANVSVASWMQANGVCVNYGMPASQSVVPVSVSTWTTPPYPLVVRLDPPLAAPAVSGLGAAALIALAGGMLILSWMRFSEEPEQALEG